MRAGRFMKNKKTKIILIGILILCSSFLVSFQEVKAALEIIGSYDTPETATDVFVKDDIAYVADWKGGLQIIDVSDPKDPKLKNSYDPMDYIPWIPSDGIYDIGDLRNYRDRFTLVSRVHIQGNYAYVLDQSWTGSAGLHIIDISNPENLIHKATFREGGLSLAVRGNYAYIGWGYGEFGGGISVVDVSNPSAPSLKKRVPSHEHNVDDIVGWIQQNEGEPSVGDGPPTISDIYLSGDYAYLAGFKTYMILLIMNIADPENPSVEGYYPVLDDIATVANAIYKSGDYVYLIDQITLDIFDVSTPSSPSLKSSSTYGQDWIYDVHIRGNYAYMSSRSSFKVIDISDPAKPSLVDKCDLPDSGRAVYVSGNYAYVACGGSGLQIIDLSPSCVITPSSALITSGESVAITWSSKNADRVVNSTLGITDPKDTSGEKSFFPINKTTYELTVSNKEGEQATCETTVRVQEPLPILSGPCQNLVPCGTSKNPEKCTLRHIFVMIKNIVNCLVLISTIICLLFIVIGGLLYIFSLGNPENLTKAKNTILWALGGLALVFLAWLIVNTMMYWMGVDESFLMWNSVG